MRSARFFLSIITIFYPFFLQGYASINFNKFLNIVKKNVKVNIPEYPGAFNPSLIQTKEGVLLFFRLTPVPDKIWVSYLGAVFLNEQFEPIGTPQLISTRMPGYSDVVSQSEDIRVLKVGDKLYVVYNDNIEVERPTIIGRRDMFVAELKYIEGSFELDIPIKLTHPKYVEHRFWEKNWTPFSWNDQLFFSYMLNPHEVVVPDLETGSCTPLYETSINERLWQYGAMRGGTPATLVDGQYLGFFHSAMRVKSSISRGIGMWHYFMGAYTCNAEPPFNLTSITVRPIVGKNFYTVSDFNKRVIFPGGFIVLGEEIHIALGKDDSEIWICTIDKTQLRQAMFQIPSGGKI